MAPHSSTLAWKIPGMEGPGRLQTRLSDFTFTFHFQALEKEMATHSSVLAWRIPGTGEPGGLPSLGLHRVGHDWSDLAAAAAAAAAVLPWLIFFLKMVIQLVTWSFCLSCMFIYVWYTHWGFPGGTNGKERTCQCRRHKRHGFDPWVEKIPWRRAWQPTQYSSLENPMNRWDWQATVHRVTESQTWLKWLSTHDKCIETCLWKFLQLRTAFYF